jgi:hypothetical protein
VSSLSGHDRPVRTPAALWRVIDGCAVIFHEETGRAFALNESATRIWEMCEGDVTLGELGEVVGESGRESVEHLLDQLVEEGFVVMENATPSGASTCEPADAKPYSLFPTEGEWALPAAEEIRFAACDCSGSPYGLGRNAECLLVNPGQTS